MFLTIAALASFSAPVLAAPEASSFRTENKLGANYWNAKSAIDGKMDTAWQVPGDSANKGEWVMFDVPKGTVDSVAIFPGWGMSEEKFADYARIKAVKVEIFCCTGDEKQTLLGTHELQLVDKAEMQVLDIEDTAVGNDMGFGGKVKITVTEFYEGRDFPNLAVSEMLIHMKPYDAAGVIEDIGGTLASNPKENMQDDDPRTFWAGPADASITFEASGYGIAAVAIIPGPATHARPKVVKVTANDRSTTSTLENSDKLQYAKVPTIMGYTGSAWGEITVEIVEVYPGSGNAEVGITEFKPQATNYDGF